MINLCPKIMINLAPLKASHPDKINCANKNNFVQLLFCRKKKQTNNQTKTKDSMCACAFKAEPHPYIPT